MNPIERFLLYVVLPAIVLASVAEGLVLARRGGYDWRAMGVSLFDLFTRVALQIAFPLSIAAPLVRFAWEHRLTTIDLAGWQAFLMLFIGQEFCYYWYHRAAHRVRWFWLNHSVHHSPNELNLSAAYRIGLLGKQTGSALFFVPLVWLGFPIGIVLLTLTLNLLYQFWLHTTWIPRLGWLEYVLNTPSGHRVHHAANPEYLDANYGGVLIVFDRLFGTYTAERDDLPCRYGLVHPVQGHNPLRIEFAQWLAFARDLRDAPDPKSFLAYFVMPPGWHPDERCETTEVLRRRSDVSQAARPVGSAAAP